MSQTDPLQGYYYNVRAQRYMRAGRGGFVARRHIIDLLRRSVEGRAESVRRGTQALLDGEIDADVWLSRTKELLKRQYLQCAALGAGGWDRLGPIEYGSIGWKLRGEYAHLEAFAGEIERGEVSMAQALNRANMYLGGAYAMYYLIERDRLPPPDVGKYWQERRVLGVAEHCTDCVHYAGMSWQPQGVLPVPTEGSACGNNCRCSLERRMTWVTQ